MYTLLKRTKGAVDYCIMRCWTLLQLQIRERVASNGKDATSHWNGRNKNTKRYKRIDRPAE